MNKFLLGFFAFWQLLGIVSVTIAHAGDDISYYYCRRDEGNSFTDFAISIQGNIVTLHVYSAPEAPGSFSYRGFVKKITPAGNMWIDFDSGAQSRYMNHFPNMVFSKSLFNKEQSGEIRVMNTPGVRDSDTIMSCEVKKIFF